MLLISPKRSQKFSPKKLSEIRNTNIQNSAVSNLNENRAQGDRGWSGTLPTIYIDESMILYKQGQHTLLALSWWKQSLLRLVKKVVVLHCEELIAH